MSSDRALCAGRYRLERPLGRGPSGVVYSATDLETGRPCALKRLHAQFYDEAALTELQRDALLQLQLAHPAIVAPQATGFDEDGGFFLVMELVEGEPLRARLQRGPLSPRETLEVLTPLCAALEAAHGVGLHHGDLSPANVLCPPGGAARLCDFGMHRLGAAADARWSGPPGYVPPEVYRGEAPTASAAGDVFALGAILFECLTGERLFAAPSPSAVMFKICVAPLPVLPATVQGDRDRLEALIAMACSKDPAGRFEHAGALLRALRVVLVEEPARTPTAPMSVAPIAPAAPPAQLAPVRPALPAMPALRLPPRAAPEDLGPDDDEPLPPPPRFGVIAGWASAGGLAMAMLLLLVRARPAERPAPTPVAVAPAPPPAAPEPPAPLTAARLLAAEERYAAQDYIAALAAAEELLRAQPDDPAVRDLQRRAREALRLQAVYQGFLRAAERGETDAAVALYRELPQGSTARTLAQPRFAAVRARFEQHHLAVATAALDRGVCDEVQRQADEILLVAESADDAAAVQGRRLAARCRGQSTAPARPAPDRAAAAPAQPQPPAASAAHPGAQLPTANAPRPGAQLPMANQPRPPALAAADARRRPAAPPAGALRGALKDPFRDGKR